jgi:hypothetical protein
VAAAATAARRLAGRLLLHRTHTAYYTDVAPQHLRHQSSRTRPASMTCNPSAVSGTKPVNGSTQWLLLAVAFQPACSGSA